MSTWNDTYGGMFMKGSSVAIREYQWREAFARNDGTSFSFVIEGRNGELVGFAKGTRASPSAAAGELSKIYLLRDWS